MFRVCADRGPRRIACVCLVVTVAVVMASGCKLAENGRTVSSTTSSAPAVSGAAEGLTPDRLAAAVTGSAVLAHVRALQAIADHHGGNRAAGTPGYDASAGHVAGLLRLAGFTVSTPRFDYPRFNGGTTTLTADGADVPTAVLQYSAGTDGSPVSGVPVSAARLGCAAADYPAASRGAVLVVDRGECTFARKAELAEGAGAVAMVVANTSDDPLRDATLEPDGARVIPVVAVARDLATRVRGARSLTVTSTATTTTITSRNVIADTRTGSPDDVVMVGAHLDSVPEGPGINDNATGVAAVLETALRLGATPPVNRAVRFAFWGAEEDGLVGSSRYVQRLGDRRRSISAYLNFDMLGSPNAGYFVLDGDGSDADDGRGGPTGSDRLEQILTDYYDERGIATSPTGLVGRSDYQPFVDIGVPVGGADTGAEQHKSGEQAQQWGGRADSAFDPNYHTPADTLGNVAQDALAISAPAVGYAVATCALSPGPEIC